MSLKKYILVISVLSLFFSCELFEEEVTYDITNVQIVEISKNQLTLTWDYTEEKDGDFTLVVEGYSRLIPFNATESSSFTKYIENPSESSAVVTWDDDQIPNQLSVNINRDDESSGESYFIEDFWDGITFEADMFESIDGDESFHSLTEATNYYLTLDSADDYDLYSFDYEKDKKYTVAINGAIPYNIGDSYYSEDIVKVTVSDEIDFSSDSWHSFTPSDDNFAFTFSASEAGTKYIKVESVNGATDDYNLSILSTMIDSDVYEPNDGIYSAEPISVNDSIYASLDSYLDVDFYSFDAISGQQYIISSNSEDIDENWYIETNTRNLPMVELYTNVSDNIYDVLSEDMTTGNKIWQCESSGIYYLKVFEDFGTYHLDISEVDIAADSYETDDQIENASDILRYETQYHTIHSPYDIDWLKFDADSSVHYLITVDSSYDEDGLWAYLYPTLTIYAADGVTVVDEYRYMSTQTVQFPTDGTYYLSIEKTSAKQLGTYSVTIE